MKNQILINTYFLDCWKFNIQHLLYIELKCMYKNFFHADFCD